MHDQSQCDQIEMLSKMALLGGHYHWNTTPIVDGDPESGDFHISRPQNEWRREAAKANREFVSIASAQPHLTAASFRGAGPDNALKPDRVERAIYSLIADIRAEYDLPESEGEATGNEHLPLSIHTTGQARRRLRGVARDKAVRVSSDRKVAIDAALPLGKETLASWEGWLYKRFKTTGRAFPYFQLLRGFIQRVKGGRSYNELGKDERQILDQIVGKIVEVSA